MAIFVGISCYMVAWPEVWWTLPLEGACLDGLDFVVVLRVVLSARRGLRPSGKQTQEGLTWHGVVSFAFRHLLSTVGAQFHRSWDTFLEQKIHSFERIFFECVATSERIAREQAQTEVCEGSGGNAAIATLRQSQKDRASSPAPDAFGRLTGIGSKLRQDAVNDWVEDTLR